RKRAGFAQGRMTNPRQRKTKKTEEHRGGSPRRSHPTARLGQGPQSKLDSSARTQWRARTDESNGRLPLFDLLQTITLSAAELGRSSATGRRVSSGSLW